MDTQSRKVGVAFRKAVEAFGKGSPSIIVNTHRHTEHVVGNELFGEAPVIIAHALVRGKLRSGSYLFDEFPDSAYSYYSNYELAMAHDRLGHREAAVRYCRTAAEQNPDSARIAAFLAELTSRPAPSG